MSQTSELIQAIELLVKERDLDAEVLFTAIEEALVFAYKREFDAKASDNVSASVDRETGEMRVFLEKEVVEEVEDQNSQIALSEALLLSEDFEIGDVLEYELSPKDFGRLAATTAKNVIYQKICSAEKEKVQKEFATRLGELVSGVIERRDRRDIVINIGQTEAILPASEQIRGENYEPQRRMRFYVLRVDERAGRPVVVLSRSHPSFVKKLFESEVPEIKEGVVEVINCVREPGIKSKVSVYSHHPNVEALGACVGPRGIRVQAIMEELGQEKIDIILWSEDPEQYIKQALNPAKVLKIQVAMDVHESTVAVADHQLSLAIGRDGVNARLAARLTGWKINILPRSEYDAIYAKALEAVEQEETDESQTFSETAQDVLSEEKALSDEA